MGPGPKSSQSSVAKDGSKGYPPAEDSKRVGIFQSAVRSNLHNPSGLNCEKDRVDDFRFQILILLLLS